MEEKPKKEMNRKKKKNNGKEGSSSRNIKQASRPSWKHEETSSGQFSFSF